jgi:SAM-dependent methyltransferase
MKIKTITRLTLERQIRRVVEPTLYETILEIGASQTFSPYKEFFKTRRYFSLDRDFSFGPHLCSDIRQMGIQNDKIDAVLLFEVLEHIFHPHQAIEEVYRVLKPGGICILSTRFIFQYHPSPKDYYRFSQDALQALFEKFKEVTILPHGDRLQAVWQLIMANELDLPRSFLVKALRRLNPLFALRDKSDKQAPLGYLVKAIK